MSAGALWDVTLCEGSYCFPPPSATKAVLAACLGYSSTPKCRWTTIGHPARERFFRLQFVQLLLCSLIIFTYEFCFLHFLPFYIYSCLHHNLLHFSTTLCFKNHNQLMLQLDCSDVRTVVMNYRTNLCSLLVVTMEITVLWDMMPCCLVDSYCFRGSCCRLLQGKWLSQVWEEVIQIYGVASPEPVPWVTLEKGHKSSGCGAGVIFWGQSDWKR